MLVVLCYIMHIEVCETKICICLILFLELLLLISWQISFCIIVWANNGVVCLMLCVCLTFRAQIKRMQIVQHVARVWMIALDILATLILNYLCFMLVIFVQLSQCCKQYVRYAETMDVDGCMDNVLKTERGWKRFYIYIYCFVAYLLELWKWEASKFWFSCWIDLLIFHWINNLWNVLISRQL